MTDLSIAALGRRYRGGDLSPEAVAADCLDRIARHDGAVGAFVTVTPERALADARRAAQALARGDDRGPLHGVPYVLKDIIDTAGILTTCQSRSRAARIPARDAHVVARLTAAGAVLLGKTATWEFAYGGPSWDALGTPTRNPWNPERHAEGSSSGAAAAVAAGFASFAIGTDTGGSIRLPASACGVTGLKPTYGRVGRSGVAPCSAALDHVGPLALSAADAAAVLAAIAGPDGGDPDVADAPFAPVPPADLSAVTVGVPRGWFEREAPVSAVVRNAFEAALAVLRGAGARVVDVTLPPLRDYTDAKEVIALREIHDVYAAEVAADPDAYGASFRWRTMAGALVGDADLARARQRRRELDRDTAAAFAAVDVLATPTIEPAGRLEPTPHELLLTGMVMTTPFNVTGQPAVSVPCGFAPDGMPLGLQLAGRPFDEGSVLAIAAAYQERTGWHLRRPAL
ncbi:Asp-tRNA(Asn)/Glu-tRNA(Gln) amidotransferase GatCAB subunit A [Acuticoccus sediminis]|uniref:Asp-tRNA(Asn)/Glu-tRNA(Gln) amidotransferase GatCAB subunit A n=1 Tax=Acuticoccus sediminis TaxID=2184697 RepID=A0A8B2NQM3_9HYPH|nr:amidase [Acuticoccus sediminis]RAI02195.1 Asp-tRNA(Asn)/Glu-tRNA(Gln) amidotransferase GatCAB subunit A [Acuticoccus sediminis]